MNQVTITYEGDEISCDPDKTILDNLLDQQKSVTHSCKKGSCLTCVMKTSHEVDPKSTAPLKPTMVEQGYFLSCQQKPQSGMVLSAPESNDLFIKAQIKSVEYLMGHVFRVYLRPLEDFNYRAGQFLNIKGPEGEVRSYSIASIPADDLIELHVTEHKHGIVSRWLCNVERTGAEIEISGANGDCFYMPGKPEQAMLLIGTSTGLAPLLGIIRDAIDNGHHGKIVLYHGAVRDSGLYMRRTLSKLAEETANLTICYGTLEHSDDNDNAVGNIQDIALSKNPNLKDWRVFLCGDPEMVKKTKTKAYLADAALSDILADPFELRTTL
ncbi:MAG: 2Fe-2S iron-sulfur cluster binding domain-containing protein [Emcibacteraceae bacterium]|nr:2Fe-2S iron-sulfur cluster binding domain-containing protein [Emcibacteraceae bacterium]